MRGIATGEEAFLRAVPSVWRICLVGDACLLSALILSHANSKTERRVTGLNLTPFQKKKTHE